MASWLRTFKAPCAKATRGISNIHGHKSRSSLIQALRHRNHCEGQQAHDNGGDDGQDCHGVGITLIVGEGDCKVPTQWPTAATMADMEAMTV